VSEDLDHLPNSGVECYCKFKKTTDELNDTEYGNCRCYIKRRGSAPVRADVDDVSVWEFPKGHSREDY
jgi:hypothetical protein